jgi:hypothetical protein
VGTKEGEKSAASGSPSEWMTVAMEESGGVPSLSVTVGGQEASTEGAVEERAWQSAWMRGTRRKRGTTVADAFYGGPVARAERKKGWGSGVWRRVEGKMGQREGGPGAAGNNLGGQHRPPAGGHGWHRCRVTGEGGGARATRA